MVKKLLFLIIISMFLITACSNKDQSIDDNKLICYSVDLDDHEVTKEECSLESVNEQKFEEMVPAENSKLKKYVDGWGYRRRAFVFVWEDDVGEDHCVCEDATVTHDGESKAGCGFIKGYLPNEIGFESCFN